MRPSYYEIKPGVELFDAFESFGFAEGFLVGSAVKYLLRRKPGANRIDDVRKALTCVERELARLEREAKPKG